MMSKDEIKEILADQDALDLEDIKAERLRQFFERNTAELPGYCEDEGFYNLDTET